MPEKDSGKVLNFFVIQFRRNRYTSFVIHSDFDDDDKKCDIISSDDVFQHCFKIRNLNGDIGKKQSALINEAFAKKADISRGTYKVKQLNGLDDIERYHRDIDDARRLRKSSSAYISKYRRVYVISR